MQNVRLRLFVLPLLLLLAACTSLQPQPEGRALTGAEIEALFSDRTFTMIGMKTGNELVVYAGAEQCTMRYVNGTRTKSQPWYVEGDHHCCMRKGEPACGPVYEVAPGVYHKFIDGRHSQTMKNFTPGNHL